MVLISGVPFFLKKVWCSDLDSERLNPNDAYIFHLLSGFCRDRAISEQWEGLKKNLSPLLCKEPKNIEKMASKSKKVALLFNFQWYCPSEHPPSCCSHTSCCWYLPTYLIQRVLYPNVANFLWRQNTNTSTN